MNREYCKLHQKILSSCLTTYKIQQGNYFFAAPCLYTHTDMHSLHHMQKLLHTITSYIWASLVTFGDFEIIIKLSTQTTIAIIGFYKKKSKLSKHIHKLLVGRHYLIPNFKISILTH